MDPAHIFTQVTAPAPLADFHVHGTFIETSSSHYDEQRAKLGAESGPRNFQPFGTGMVGREIQIFSLTRAFDAFHIPQSSTKSMCTPICRKNTARVFFPCCIWTRNTPQPFFLPGRRFWKFWSVQGQSLWVLWPSQKVKSLLTWVNDKKSLFRPIKDVK